MDTVDVVMCGHVVTMEGGLETPKGAVACNDGIIVAIGTEVEILEQYTPDKVLRGERGVVLPGLVNTHTHAPMALMRGLADDLPLMTWLQDHIFPVEAQLTPELVYQGAQLSILEMIKSGTTCFCDMYLFAAEVARAAENMGMRGMIGEVLYDFDSPNYGKLENGFSYMDDLFSRFQDSKTVSISVDPHAIYTCSANLLIRLKEYAAKKNVPYVIHLAETKFEVSECLQNNGSTPVAYLDHLGVLDSSVIAAHCVELTSADVEMMAATGVAVAHCPESNMKLASGIAPVVDLLKAGISVGLGTDGAASNNDVDLFCEMDMAAKLQKVDHLNSAVMDAQTTLNMATLGGAHVLGMQSEIGSLVAGKKADLIMVEMNKPHLTPMYNPVSHLVYSVNGGDVLHSIIDGKVVMEDRVLTMIDEQQILAACRISAEKLTGRNC